LADLAALQKQFPNAKIYSSSFDEFLPYLQSAQKAGALPVVTSEAGDSWVWGVASDPLKTAQGRAVQRARAWCAYSCDCDHFSYEYLNFTRLLLKVGEHTDGGDVKMFLEAYVSNSSDYYQWSNEQFARVRHSKASKNMAASWVEQRQWGIEAPLAALPKSHPLYRTARDYLAELHPSVPSTRGFTAHSLTNGPVRFATPDGRLTFALCPHHGYILNLTDHSFGATWSSGEHPLAALVYQTFTEGDFGAFRDRYGMCATKECTWAAMDFGKAGLDAAAHPVHQDLVRPTVKGIWSYLGADEGGALEILIELVFDKTNVQQYGAPETAWVSLVLPPGDTVSAHSASSGAQPGREPLGATIDITVTLLNKTSTKMPEAMWLTFDPIRPWHQQQQKKENVASHTDAAEPGWMLTKLNSLVQASDVVLNGSQSLHGLWADAILGSGDSAPGVPSFAQQLRVSSLDVALVHVAPPKALSPFPALDPAVHDVATDSISFGLFNNMSKTHQAVDIPTLLSELTESEAPLTIWCSLLVV
jgi:hypothetical protein